MDRLWYCEHVLEVRRDGMGTEVVEGRLRNFYDPKDVQVNAKAFEKMNNLWLLHLDYVHLTAGYEYEHISRRLLWLSWKGFPLDCIPWNFSMEKLVALDLRYSSLKKVWNGNMILDNLKFLYLSHCHCLTRTPNFSGLNSLEELLLNDCKSLVEVDESIRCLNKLLVLDMKNCTKLRKLPSGIWMLKSLKRLDLSGCSKLGNFAEFKRQLHKLWGLFFSSWTLPTKGVSSIGFPLTHVQASGCLTELNLKNCHLSYLPGEIGNLISLRTLDLTKNKLSILPDSICNLICLNRLRLDDNNLSHLPSGIGRLTSLAGLYLSRNSLCTLPDTIDGLVSLSVLDIEENNICTILDSVINIPSLVMIQLNNCAKLRSLPKLPICRVVDALCCPSLESLPLELDQLGMAVNYSDSNKLAENNYLTSLLKQLPKTKGLSKLQHAINIVVPAGDEEVRIWFPYHDGRGPNVSFVMPPSPSVKQKLLGWILRLLLRVPRESPYKQQRLLIQEVICNKIKKRVYVLPVLVDPSDVDRVWLLYIPQGYKGMHMPKGYNRLQLEGGDEMEIPIDAYPKTPVKNWAIDLIYEADEIHKATDTLYQVVSIL